MSRIIKSPLDGTEVINFVGTTSDQNSGSTTVQDIADLAGGGSSQIQSNETIAAPYTGVELPSVAGINTGDTKTIQFNDGTVVNYTWDGTAWVKDFEDEYNFVGEINIVIDGQSNSIGQQAGSTFPLKVLNNLKVWNGSAWVNPQLGVAPFNPNGADNMGLRFAEKLAIENPQHRIKLIQLGNNGLPLSHWIASPYTGLFNVLNTLNSSGIPRVDVFIWDQGESDNLNTNYISEYYSGLIANLLSFPQIDDRTKFLNVGMYTGPGAVYPLKDADFRAIGIDDNEYTSYVNTDNLEAYDNVHFTNQSMIILGYDRIYNAYLNTPYTFKPDTPPLNGIRSENGNIYRGSDSQTVPKGSQLIHNTFNHLNGFNDSWVSTTENVFIINNTRDSENVITETVADIKVNDAYIGRGKGNIYGNTVVGLALRNNTTGLNNSSFGNSNLFSNTTGSYNTAVGANTLPFNIGGSNNVAVGEQSLYGNVSGNDNVSVGKQSLYSNVSGSGNVSIGNAAGYAETGSNKLYIANTSTLTPLIGGDFSTQELKIGGVQQFTVQYATTGVSVANGSMFYGTDGALYFKGGSGTVTQIAAP
jgi:hypothetical protein